MNAQFYNRKSSKNAFYKEVNTFYINTIRLQQINLNMYYYIFCRVFYTHWLATHRDDILMTHDTYTSIISSSKLNGLLLTVLLFCCHIYIHTICKLYFFKNNINLVMCIIANLPDVKQLKWMHNFTIGSILRMYFIMTNCFWYEYCWAVHIPAIKTKRSTVNIR